MLLPRTTPSVRSVWLALVCMAISGCGAGTMGASESAPSVPTTTAPTATSDNGGGQTTEALAYLPWGPDDPVIPQWYADLADTRCTGESPGGDTDEFWDTAWAVCRAVFDHGPWPSVTASPPAPSAQDPHDACLDNELRQFVDRALAWRGAHPGATPQVDRPAQPSPCFLRVYDVRLEDGGGPGRAGDVVRAVLTVDGTYQVSSVQVDGGDTADPPPTGSGQALQQVEVTLLRTEVDRTVEVTLQFSSQGAVMGASTAQVGVPGLSGSSPEPAPTGGSSGSEPSGTPASPTGT